MQGPAGTKAAPPPMSDDDLKRSTPGPSFYIIWSLSASYWESPARWTSAPSLYDWPLRLPFISGRPLTVFTNGADGRPRHECHLLGRAHAGRLGLHVLGR